jgi:flagellar hook protein FlgE
VVNPEGSLLQGFTVDSSGNLTGAIGDLNLSTTSFPPNATTTVDITANMDSTSTIPAACSVTNPAGTSNFSTALTVFDSLGNGHLITIYFRKSIEAATGNTWEWFGVVPGADNANGTSDEIQAQGTLTFTPSGALNTESAITYPTGGFDFSGGATQNQAIAINFGTSIAEGGTGLTETTQFGSNSATLLQSQNGFSSGSLQNLAVNQDGIITGLFSNGRNRILGQVALATFTAQEGLTRVGKNLFAETIESGQPLTGTPNSAGRGSILPNSLELSNVDLAEQFVNLITAQRGFQANARIITTTDEILGELVNLRR